MNKRNTFIGVAGHPLFGRTVSIPEANRMSHTLVIGMTGSGKTTTLRSIIGQDVGAGRSVIVIDGKGDPGILGSLKDRFDWILFGSEVEGTLSYNPLRGAHDQVVSAFINACRFENEFYKGCAARLLHAYLNWCPARKGAPVPNIEELARLSISLSSVNDELTSSLPNDSFLTNTFDALREIGATRFMQYHAGLANRLDTLVHSKWADHLCAVNVGAKPQVNFDRAFQEPCLIYIGLQKLANEAGANFLGRMLLARIGNLAADRARHSQSGGLAGRPVVSVVVDELAGIAYPGFETLPQTVRSSGIMLTLATQTLSDLKCISEDFSTQIQTNTGVKILHRINSEKDADTWAKHIGTTTDAERPLDRLIELLNRDRRDKPERRFIIDPDTLKNLKAGVAVIEQWGKRTKRRDIVAVADIERMKRNAA